MANTKSARKSVRKIQRKTEVNTARRSRIRTYIKHLDQAIQSGDATAAQAAFRDAQSEILRGVTKGVMHLSTASRKISRLNKNVQALSEKAA